MFRLFKRKPIKSDCGPTPHDIVRNCISEWDRKAACYESESKMPTPWKGIARKQCPIRSPDLNSLFYDPRAHEMIYLTAPNDATPPIRVRVRDGSSISSITFNSEEEVAEWCSERVVEWSYALLPLPIITPEDKE